MSEGTKPIDLGECLVSMMMSNLSLSTGKGLNEWLFVSLAKGWKPNGCWISASNPTRGFQEDADADLGPDLSEINFDDLIYYQKGV